MLVLGSTTAQVGLVKELTAAVSTDGFLNSVLESIKESDDKIFCIFFLDAAGVLCYQQAEDVRARVCVPSTCPEAVLRAAYGDSVLTGHLGINVEVIVALVWDQVVFHLKLQSLVGSGRKGQLTGSGSTAGGGCYSGPVRRMG